MKFIHALIVSTAMIHFEAFETEVDAQNKYYEIAMWFTESHKSLGLILSLLYCH